jgi:hypothetical protein
MGGYARHALRDAAILAAALALWSIDSRLRGAPGAGPALAAGAAGAVTALAGYLGHEWGHLLGGRLGGAVLHPPAHVTDPFLFRFDADRNGRAQFAAMSLGGFAASAAIVAALLAWLPLDALSGRVALGLTAAGVLATLVLEVPPFVRVLRGGAIPRGAAYVSRAGAGPGAGALGAPEEA